MTLRPGSRSDRPRPELPLRWAGHHDSDGTSGVVARQTIAGTVPGRRPGLAGQPRRPGHGALAGGGPWQPPDRDSLVSLWPDGHGGLSACPGSGPGRPATSESELSWVIMMIRVIMQVMRPRRSAAGPAAAAGGRGHGCHRALGRAGAKSRVGRGAGRWPGRRGSSHDGSGWPGGLLSRNRAQCREDSVTGPANSSAGVTRTGMTRTCRRWTVPLTPSHAGLLTESVPRRSRPGRVTVATAAAAAAAATAHGYS